MKYEEPDPETILAAAQGHEAAFGRLVRLYQDSIFRMAYRMTFDRHEAYDLSQEVFLRLFRGLPSFDRSRPFTPWFMRLAANTCINALKKSRSQTQGARSLEACSGALDPADKGPGVESESEEAERAERLKHAVSSLPPEYRAVIGLRYMDGRSCEEISGILGIPVGTVKNRLFRAREKLRNAVELKRAGIA